MAYHLALEAIAKMGSDSMTDREARELLALAVAVARLELAIAHRERTTRATRRKAAKNL